MYMYTVVEKIRLCLLRKNAQLAPCLFVFRYMKGRIAYDQVNNAIDEIHKVLTTKYKILSLPRSAMGEPVMMKYKVRSSDEAGLEFETTGYGAPVKKVLHTVCVHVA